MHSKLSTAFLLFALAFAHPTAATLEDPAARGIDRFIHPPTSPMTATVPKVIEVPLRFGLAAR